MVTSTAAALVVGDDGGSGRGATGVGGGGGGGCSLVYNVFMSVNYCVHAIVKRLAIAKSRLVNYICNG